MSFRSVVDLQDYSSRGLAHAMGEAVRAGQLREGDRLPPIRTVAKDLQLSPTTVSAAWSALARRGVIRTDGRRGTTVAGEGTPGPTRYRRALDSRTSFALDLSTGVPDPALLPTLTSALRRVPQSGGNGSYLDDPVLPDLRAVLRDTWPYDAESLTVADGAMDALDLICGVHLEPGDTVAVEHPCFPPMLDLLDACGMRLHGLAMDDEGPTVEAVRVAVRRRVAAVVLQPRAHNPTGICMSAQRAQELAEVLRETDTLVVEDDSAGEVGSSPYLSLGRWIPDQVLHIRSFSKSHGPDLRLAAVSGATARVDPLSERRLLGQGWSSRLLQAVLVELLTGKEPVRRVLAARQAYADRRAGVVDALAAEGVRVPGTDGLNVWLPVLDEAAALVQLAGRGIGAAAGSPFHVVPDDSAHLRITTGLVRCAGADDELVDAADLSRDLADAARATAWAGPR